MKIKLQLASLILFISVSRVFAQSDFRDGFIITTDNDTIYGQIDYRSNVKNYKSCSFKESNKIREYSPLQLSGFGYVNDKFFTSKIVPDSFVEVLVEGDLNLYKTKTNYLVRKNEGKIYKLECHRKEVEHEGIVEIRDDNRWKGIISYLISDGLSNANSIVKKLYLNQKSLTKVITMYNHSKRSNLKVYKENKPWTKIDIGAAVSLISSSLEFENKTSSLYYLSKSFNSVDPAIGLVMAVSFPRLTEKIIFQPEVYFTKSSYSTLTEPDKVSKEYHDTYIDLNTISVPISLKYNIPIKKYSLNILGGIYYDYNIKSSTEHINETIYSDVVITSREENPFEIDDNHVGYCGGIGISKSFKHFDISTSIRYKQTIQPSNTKRLITNGNKLSLNIIIFKK